MIRTLAKSDVNDTALLHKQGMPNDFLPSFGIDFLKEFHKKLFQAKGSIAKGYFYQGKCLGFIIGSIYADQLLKEIFIKGFFHLTPHVLKKILSSPKSIKYIYQTFAYGNKRSIKLSVELVIIAVAQNNRRKGIGTKLLSELKREFKQRGFTQCSVSTTSSNLISNKFYLKQGAKIVKSFKLYDREWNTYAFRIK